MHALFELICGDILTIEISGQKAPRVGLRTTGGARSAPPLSFTYDLLTSGKTNYDIEVNPHIIAPDPFADEDCLDVFSWSMQYLTAAYGEPKMMNQDDEISGLHGRLRPRKTVADSQSNQNIIRKLDHRSTEDKLKIKKRAFKSSQKTNRLLLCPYCVKRFSSKQSLSKHLKRTHFSTIQNESSVIECQFCGHPEDCARNVFKHMIDNHPNEYFGCLHCQSRFLSATELAEHRLNACEKQKSGSLRPYRSKLRRRCNPNSPIMRSTSIENHDKDEAVNNSIFPNDFKNIVISCELKPSQIQDTADIENNITANVILPSCKSMGNSTTIEKNSVIVLDNLQWNKKISGNISFHNNDTDLILSRLGVVHRSPRTSESTKRHWYKYVEDVSKFEKCFDTSFYSKVASNVQENISKYLDGSFNRLSPDADNTIKTRKSKNSVVINTVEGFPILLAPEQYLRNSFESYMPRTISPKHKCKWDNNESDKLSLAVHEMKGDSHANNCIITLVSKLDIWTQLCMRRKFELKFNCPSFNTKKTEKLNIIGKELKEILESREIPDASKQFAPSTNNFTESLDQNVFPASLGLIPSIANYDIEPAVLSGEWVRPRKYVCCACGEQTQDSKTLSSHISSQHPNAQVAHYEIVGEPLLNSDILKHLYVPPGQPSNRIRPLRGSRECTKCKMPVTLEDLHQHMLECAGDTPVIRRKCRYRPFGVRRRRTRLPDNRMRKKIRKELRNRQTRQMKYRQRSRQKIRTEVGDGETIRKMIADLPAKRHRVSINSVNSISRPRKKLDNARYKLCLRRRVLEDPKSKKLRSGEHNDHTTTKRDIIDNKSFKNPQKLFLKAKTSCVRRTTVRITKTEQRKITKSNIKRQPENKLNITSMPVIKISSPMALSPEKRTELNDTNDQVSTIDYTNRIDVNVGQGNIKKCSAQEGSDYRDSRRPGCNDQDKGDFSQNSTPHKVPLKHSIERLTANTDTHGRANRLQQNFYMNQEYLRNFAQSSHLISLRHQPLFENEAIVTKLDKPPLNWSQNIDSCILQKNRLQKSRKGLNDCIAMLKNKLVEPIPSTSGCQIVSVPKAVVKPDDNLPHLNLEMPKTNTSTVFLPESQCVMTPLDLSGKSQRLESQEYCNEATDLCTKNVTVSLPEQPKETYTTLDLSNKSMKVNVEKSNKVIPDKSSYNLNVAEDTSTCSTRHSETTLDLSFKQKLSNDNSANVTLDLTSRKSPNEVIINTDNKTVMDVDQRTVAVEKIDGLKKPLEKVTAKIIQNSVFDKLVTQKPIYDPTLKIPQYKIRGVADQNIKETDKDSNKSPSETPNIDLLPKEIVDILGTMPVQHRDKLLNVLPQVFAKTVKQLKLVVDSTNSKVTITSPNKNEIATQTSSTSLEQLCPPEFMNIDTDKYLIDPCTGAITERAQAEETLSIIDKSAQDKIIDLTLEENVNISISEEIPKKDVNESVVIKINDTSNTEYVHKLKVSNEQTASLRAVRIKSSNEKSKCFKEDKKCAHIPENIKVLANVTSNVAIDNIDKKGILQSPLLETSLAIQQAEVSSTQQNNCHNNLSTTSLSAVLLSEKDKKVNTLENSGRFDKTINKDDKKELLVSQDVHAVTAPSELGQNLMPTETIQSKTENKFDVNEILNIENNLTQSHNKTCLESELNLNDQTLPMLNESPLQSSTPKIISDKNDFGQCQKKIHVSEQLEDDDPEDNVSLAFIVKQKKLVISSQSQESPESKSKIYTKNTASESDFNIMDTKTLPIKKPEKRRRNKKVRTNKKSNRSPFINKFDEINGFNNTKDVKGNQNVVVTNNNHNNYKSEEDISVNGKEAEINTAFDLNILTDTTTINLLAGEDSTNSNKVSAQSELYEDVNKVLIKQSNSEIIESNIEMKINPDPQPDNTLKMVGENMKIHNKNHDLVEEVNETCEVDNKSLKSNHTQESFKKNDDVSVKILENHESSVSYESIIGPVRRSKRVKSLYTEKDGTGIKEFATRTEYNEENKTPLTKKQLIFSKLLLDEENYNKSSQLNSKIEGKIFNNRPQITMDDTNITNLHNQAKGTAVKEVAVEEIDKNSTYLKYKCKKKISFCSPSNENDVVNCNNQKEQNMTNMEIYSTHNNDVILNTNKVERYKANVENPAITQSVATTSNVNVMGELPPEHVVVARNSPDINLKLVDQSNLPMTLENNTNMAKYVEKAEPLSDSVTFENLENEREEKKEFVNKGKKKLSSTTVSAKSTLVSINKSNSESGLEKRKSLISKTGTSRYSKSKKPKLYYPQFESSSSDDDSERHISFYKNNIRKASLKDVVRTSQKTAAACKGAGEFCSTSGKTIDTVKDSAFSLSQEPNTSTFDEYYNQPQTSESFKSRLRDSNFSIDGEENQMNEMNGNDSDDSSKSDIPLQRYIESIYKNNNQTNDSGINISTHEKDNDKTNKLCKDSLIGISNNVESVIDDATEEEMKSEQFMESFGFFSERKPRKSNLIASKKISETFNVIANDSDDTFCPNKDRAAKNVNKKSTKILIEEEKDSSSSSKSAPQPIIIKKSKKKGRKRRQHVKDMPYCTICRKEFRRRDNLYRHQMTLLHISKLSEIEMKFETVPYIEGPNYLITYKKRLDKLKKLTDQLKIDSKSKADLEKAGLPTFADIIADVNKLSSTQSVPRRDLSCDEALFLDCCELLKESHKKDNTSNDTICSSDVSGNKHFIVNSSIQEPFSISQEDTDKIDNRSDGDVDSITAKNIMESEEVRNLENDLISGLKESTSLKLSAANFANSVIKSPNETYFNEKLITETQPVIIAKVEKRKVTKPKVTVTNQLDHIDGNVFEDKFDKIKRKCRSQAVAAKTVQPIIVQKKSVKGKKKIDKRSKGKKISKKNHPATVLTKGALKGFDGIKVSIPTSDINISAIVPTLPEHQPAKKRKKSNSKKRKNKFLSYSNVPNYLNESHSKEDKKIPPKQVDVYEFMDNEDTDMLDFRTSTRLERFKSPAKEMPSTSKAGLLLIKQTENSQLSSTSGSDGDDFVYMSDDYVCSADETENSLLSCELGNAGKVVCDSKTNINQNKKEPIENDAAMGTNPFKNNVMCNNDIVDSSKEDECTDDKANLDQLFDSLLENEPNSSILLNESTSSKCNENTLSLDDNETGVARHRARRKCTVGKQNVLAETWSSESEPDTVNSARPKSVESVATVSNRKKKIKKHSGHLNIRRNRHISFKIDHDESRVTSSVNAKSICKEKLPRSDVTFNWSSAEGEESGQGESHTLVEQHGWIVGDSHKKLVTMLAHAKGRKRDDSTTFVE